MKPTITKKFKLRNNANTCNVNEIVNEVFIKYFEESQNTDSRFLFLFDSLVNHLDKIEKYFESKSEIIICLSSHLLSHLMQVRATALRVMRFILTTEQDVQLFNSLQLPFLICRSIDIILKNEEERVQALKLIRKIIAISPHSLSPCIVKCLISLADTTLVDGKPDRILRSVLATLSEIAVLTPELFIVHNGVSVITRNVIVTDSPRMNESLVAVLLHLLENPTIRKQAKVNLECIAASYCDFTYRLIGLMDKNKDTRELRFKCSRLSLLTVLKSWPGVIEFCDPKKKTCLRAIIDVMYLNQLEVRKAILDLFYELFEINQPTWSDEVSVALTSIDPSNFLSIWRLTDGFVAAEGKSILPSLRNNVPNICDTHQALLIYCLIENGMIDALIAVIVDSDTFISIRSTILLAKILQVVYTMLPENICSDSISLSNLIYEASKGNQQAVKAVATLQSYQQLLRNRPAPVSLYLDLIIQNGLVCKSHLFRREVNGTFYCSTVDLTRGNSLRRSSLDNSQRSRDGESSFSDSIFPSTETKIKQNILKFFEKFKESEKLIKESKIFTQVDCQKWDFDVLLIIFRNKLLSSKNDETQMKLIKTLITYYKPSSNKFSHVEISQGKFIQANVLVGIELLDFLLGYLNELEYLRILTDFCADINLHLQTVCKKKPHDSLFSPNHMETTMCQQYFIFIGRISSCKEGLTILKNTDILKNLIYLVSNSNHPIYAKLILSGLDYTNKTTRSILERALVSSTNVHIRLYATQFLLVLFRVKLNLIEEWGIKQLLNQLKDKERSIQITALDIIEEICHDTNYLLEIAHDFPKLHEVGEYGKYVMMHFYSTPRGLNHPEAKVEQEIKLWNETYNKKYALYVECEVHNAMTLNKRNEDGFYNDRNSNQTQLASEASSYLPLHLFGALIRTQKGFDLLQRLGELSTLTQAVFSETPTSENECLNIKSSLWAVGWIASHTQGVGYFKEFVPDVFNRIIYLAKYAEFYSLRWTAFQVLSLIATCLDGADMLLKFNWVSVRHKRYEEFPVIEPEVNLRFTFDTLNYDETIFEFTLPSLNTSSWSDFHYKPKEINKSLRTDDYYSQHQKLSIKARSLSESKTQEDFMHRVRFNSGDSNTSGISSYDSTQVKVMNDRHRRASISGVYSSPQGKMHETSISGYKKLRQIRKNLKSMFNESTSDGLDDIFEIEDITIDKKLKSLDSFKKKVKRFKDDSSIISELMEDRDDIYVSRFLTQDDKEGRCFRGVCLPKNVAELFVEKDPYHSVRTNRVNNCSSPVNMNDSLELDFQDMKISLNEEDTSNIQNEISISKDDSIFQHNLSECLRCCRYNRLVKLLENDSLHTELQELSSEYDKNIHKHQILKNIDRMASPIYFKTARMALLELKRKYPKDFQDFCLFSEVCRRVSSCSYRFHVRRFIQELFYGIDIDFFFKTSHFIVKKSLSKFDFSCSSSDSYQRHNLESILETGQSSNTLDSSSNQTTAEIHDSKSLSQFAKDDQPRPRKRIHTLELDLSCTKNRFPIKHQIVSKSVTSPTESEGRRSESFKSLMSPISLSSYSFSKPLYCEQRLLSSKSEAVLSKDRDTQQLENQPSTSSSNH